MLGTYHGMVPPLRRILMEECGGDLHLFYREMKKNKAGEKAFSGKQLSPRCSLSDVDLKKVAQDLSVNFAFKSREPPQIKLVGENPPEILKFCSFFSEIDIRIAAVKEAEIIDLFLAVKFAPFEFFIRESVAVTALFLQDREVLFFDSDFLSNLSKKCLFRCFIFINASLRKLPCSFFSAAFTDQDTRILLDKDGGDVGTVDWHAQANVLLPRSVATIKVSMAKVPSRRYVFSLAFRNCCLLDPGRAGSEVF